MSPKRVRDLLDRLPYLSSACDVDLLLFFHQHPRALLPTERLAVYVAHDTSEVAKSLETLIAADVLTHVPGPTRGARMYLLTSGGPLGGWIDALIRLASTRAGRLTVLAALAKRQPPPESATGRGAEPPVVQSSPRPAQRPRRSAMEVRHA